jgi:opacity protein-like surface antigen
MCSRRVVRLAIAGATILGSVTTADIARAAPAVTSWSGFYLGGSFGGGFGSNPWSNPDDGDLGTTYLSGPIASLQGGYNWQFNNNIIAGIDVSGGISNIQGAFDKFGWNFAAQVKGLESVAGRFGVATGTGNNTLLFVRGGLAFGQYKFTSNWPEIDTHFQADKTQTGWTIGLGMEYALTSNWSAKAEYGYYNFGSRPVYLVPNTDLVPPFPVQINNWAINVFSVGFNYRR